MVLLLLFLYIVYIGKLPMINVYADNSFIFNQTNLENCGTAGLTSIAMTRFVLPTVVLLRFALPMRDVNAENLFVHL